MNKDIEYLNKVIKYYTKKELMDNYFCWLYPFTTENIKGYYKYIDFSKKDILTVTSSGDHALNAYLLGADNVDTFDINPLAKYYSELKVACIKTLTLEEFILFLYNKNIFGIPKYYMNKSIYKKIRKELDDKYRYFWDYVFNTYTPKELYRSFIFTDDFLDIKGLTQSNIYFNKEYYYKLKDILQHKRINYYDCDIKDLININKKYNIILLSNILACLNLVYKNDDSYLEKLKNIINQIKTDDATVMVGYLYANNLNDPNPLGIYNEEEVNKVFNEDEYKYICFESTDILSKPKYLKLFLDYKDLILITK